MIIQLHLKRSDSPSPLLKSAHVVRLQDEEYPLFTSPSLYKAARAAQYEATFANRDAYVRILSGSFANHYISLTTAPRAIPAIAFLLLLISRLATLAQNASAAWQQLNDLRGRDTDRAALQYHIDQAPEFAARDGEAD